MRFPVIQERYGQTWIIFLSGSTNLICVNGRKFLLVSKMKMLSHIVEPLLYVFTGCKIFDWLRKRNIYGVSEGFHQNGQPKSRASRAAGSTPDLIRGLPVLHNLWKAIEEITGAFHLLRACAGPHEGSSFSPMGRGR